MKTQKENVIHMKPIHMKPKDNRFIVFKGGGYDGCIWEWNVIFYSTEGKPCDYLLSGRGKSWKDKCILSTFIATRAMIRENDGEIFHGSDEKSWKRFVKDFHHGLVKKVADMLQLKIECQSCGNEFHADEIFHDGYHGCGGIAIQMDGLKCAECIEIEHDEYCSKHIWPNLTEKEKADACSAYIKDNGWEFANELKSSIEANPYSAPFWYSYYAGEPEMY